MSYISEKWTLAERMALVFIVADIIRDFINMGRYGEPGTPNIQSVHELMSFDIEDMETQRDSVENLIQAYEIQHEGWLFKNLVTMYNQLGETGRRSRSRVVFD